MAEAVLTIWVIYDHPLDFPDHYVVRGQDIVRGTTEPRVQSKAYLFASLQDARDWLLQELPDLHCLGREPDDDRAIVEAWV